MNYFHNLSVQNVSVNKDGSLSLDPVEKKEGRYIVVEDGWYIYSDKFMTGSQADAVAEEMAKKNPGVDVQVYHLDFTFRGETSVEVVRR
jgi:hypothetical protein